MARTRTRSRTAATSTATATPEPEANNKADAAAAKTAARKEQDAKLLEQILKRHGDHPKVVEVYGGQEGEESLGAVAKALNITVTKAGWLLFFHAVESGRVPKITGKDEDELVKNIHAAREEAGPFSAWGWLAARSGKSESWIKSKLEKAGLFNKGSENIASRRAATATPATQQQAQTQSEGEGNKTSRRRRRGNAS